MNLSNEDVPDSFMSKCIFPRISLSDDRDCPNTALQGYCSCIVRKGGDIVSGSVDVLGSFDDGTTIEIRLEGDLENR